MSNVAKLKKKAAEFEQKKQFDKALAVYVQILDSYEERRRGGRRRRSSTASATSPAAGQRRATPSTTTSRRSTSTPRAASSTTPSRSATRSCATPRAALDLLQARQDQRAEGLQQRREAELPRVRRPDAEGRARSTRRSARSRSSPTSVPDQDDIRLMLAEQLAKASARARRSSSCRSLYERYSARGTRRRGAGDRSIA